MNTRVLSKGYAAPPLNKRDIWRYASCKEETEETAALLNACIAEAKDKLTYAVCYRVLPCKTSGALCDFGAFSVSSERLAATLHGCDTVVVFAATVGVGIDRLIAKYSRLSPSKALLFQAIGTQRIEALCDVFCADMAQEHGKRTRPRFSPGYGDLPLSVQRELFVALDCERRIGLTLNDSLLMSPTKSVTAIVGLF